MYKNQLQELAQRSCFNLPSYTCLREGPDHAPRFKATVNFNGETFESPHYCTTLRQAEHAAAEVALSSLSSRGPSHSLAARILDETGVYKNLLQEISQRVGACLPTYTTSRSGLGHQPVFTCTVELASIMFTGEPAKNKKQAEKNAAMAAWSSLKQLVRQTGNSSSDLLNNDEQEHVTIARALKNFRLKAIKDNLPFPLKFPMKKTSSSSSRIPPSPFTASKILPLIRPRSAPRIRPLITTTNDNAYWQLIPPASRVRKFHAAAKAEPVKPSAGAREELNSECRGILPPKFPATQAPPPPPPEENPATRAPKFPSVEAGPESPAVQTLKFPAAAAAPYFPVSRMAPPVTIRSAIPVFSAPPAPPPNLRPPSALGVAPPVCVRQAVPVYAAPPAQVETPPPAKSSPDPASSISAEIGDGAHGSTNSAVTRDMRDLKI